MASIHRARISRTPTLRVAAAPAPATAAQTHRSRRANQNVAIEASRKNDSE
jgi:hypothetical protein